MYSCKALDSGLGSNECIDNVGLLLSSATVVDTLVQDAVLLLNFSHHINLCICPQRMKGSVTAEKLVWMFEFIYLGKVYSAFPKACGWQPAKQMMMMLMVKIKTT